MRIKDFFKREGMSPVSREINRQVESYHGEHPKKTTCSFCDVIQHSRALPCARIFSGVGLEIKGCGNYYPIGLWQGPARGAHKIVYLF